MEDPPSQTQIWILIALLISFLLSSFFSASEVALLALSDAQVRSLRAQKKRGSSAISWLKHHPHKLIITILIGNNLVNITASVLTTVYVTNRFGSEALGIATGILTLLVLIFGEILPKTFAQQHSKRFALIASPILKYLCLALYPIVWLLEQLSNSISGQKKRKLSEAEVESELLALAEIGEEGGALEKGEKDIIENILEFSETTVEEVMMPRTQIDALNENNTLQQAIKFAIAHSHSRLPVFKKSIDEIVGIITIRDLLAAQDKFDKKKKLSDLRLRKAFFIPHTRKTSDALKDFQRKKVQIAIIVDEHGGTKGICTLEDLVEEVFGEIEDESDVSETLIRKASSSSWHVHGKTTLCELEEKTGLKLNGDDDAKTVSLLILEKLSRFPKLGEKIELPQAHIVVEKMSNNAIERVRVFEVKS